MRVLENLKLDATVALAEILSGFWTSVEEQVRVAALAGHNYSASQDDRAALLGITRQARDLEARYRASIEDAFEHWLHLKFAGGAQSLSLMSESELEMHLSGQQASESLEQQYARPLEVLDERLQALAAALGVQRRQLNPVRPEVAIGAFVALFGADDLTPGLRGMVFPLYAKRLGPALGILYSQLNEALESAGFAAPPAPVPAPMPAPVINVAAPHSADGWVPDGGMVEHHAPATEVHASAPSVGAPGGGGALPWQQGPAIQRPAQAYAYLPHQDDGRPPRYRDVVREQLRSWRERSAHGATQWTPVGKGSRPDIADDGRIFNTEDLVNVASLLQGDDPAPYLRALEGERPLAGVIREEILGGVRQMGLDPTQARFNVDEEDAIDLVGILFQSLFEANDLLTRARSMYGRLVVPYLKVALTDDSMFNRRSHPARRLLDALTEACDGNAGETPQDKETLERAEHAVDRVVGEYQDDQAIFELAASELRDQLDQQRRRSELAERRAAEAIHGRERLLHARVEADALVASRMSERLLTTPVARFLDEQWRHYLVQTWLRDGADSARHRAAIALGDAVVQVDADAALARGAAVADQLLGLQVPLGECYSANGLDAAGARESMARIISALALPDTLRRIHAPQAAQAEPLRDDDSRANLRLMAGTDTLDFDPGIAARMRRLRVGQGLRLVDATGHESSCRIAWVSPLTSRFLIVNRRGMRKLVASPEELAALVASGHAVVRSVDAPFDEAMKQVWQHLNPTPHGIDGAGLRPVLAAVSNG